MEPTQVRRLGAKLFTLRNGRIVRMGLVGTDGPVPGTGPGAALYNAWLASADGAGGTYTAQSKILASNLADALFAKSYYSSIQYVLPFFGGNLATALTPLVDKSAKGRPTNNGPFVNADFSEATGLQGNGSKYLDTKYQLSNLQGGSGLNGGYGYWERNVPAGVNYMMGARPTALFMLYGNPGDPRELMYFGSPGGFQTAVAPGNHDYFARVTDSTGCKGFRNGVEILSTATNQASASDNFCICALDGSFIGSGRCGVAYLTSGNISDANVLDLHNTFDTYIISATGR